MTWTWGIVSIVIGLNLLAGGYLLGAWITAWYLVRKQRQQQAAAALRAQKLVDDLMGPTPRQRVNLHTDGTVQVRASCEAEAAEIISQSDVFDPPSFYA